MNGGQVSRQVTYGTVMDFYTFTHFLLEENKGLHKQKQEIFQEIIEM